MRDVHSANPLFHDAYTNTDFFEVERRNVFTKTWIAIAPISQLQHDGDVLSINIASTPILITKLNNKVHAFYNTCRHRGSLLLEEGSYRNKKVICCPYHCWSYAADGKLMNLPNFPNKSTILCNGEHNLIEIHSVRVFLGIIWLNFNTDTEENEKLWTFQFGDLHSYYEYYPYASMKVANISKYEIAANWKIVIENFVELYHLPAIHPELTKISPVENHHRRQGTGQYISFGTHPLTASHARADPKNSNLHLFENLRELDYNTGWLIQIFPNVCCFVFPHHICYLFVFPRAYNHTQEHLYIVTHSGTDVEHNECRELIELYQKVNMEDIDIIEKVQKGLECRQNVQGPFHGALEEPIHRFQNILISYMVDDYLKSYEGDQSSFFDD